MTEEEAKEKWCPAVRCGSGDDSSSVNSTVSGRDDFDRNPEWSRCLGSACMMWQGDSCGLVAPDRIDVTNHY